MTHPLAWDLYRTFLSALQEGSLSGAARALGLAQPTIGRHIETLEETLGVPLFTRSQTGLRPTQAALELRGHLEAMHNIAASLERAAKGFASGASGPIRISASEVIGVEVLPPILAALHQAHPGLVVELVLSNRVQDLVQREVDIAVRMTDPQQDVLLAQRVGDVALGLFAHHDYLARRGTPDSVDELPQYDMIGFDTDTPFLRSAREQLPVWVRENFQLRCDSDLGQLALLRAGAGIGVCQLGIAQRDPNLVRVLPAELHFQLPTWIAMHADLRESPRCKTTFDTLSQGLRQYISGSPAR